TQIIFTLIGLCLLLWYPGVNHIVAPVVIGVVVIILLLGGFYIAQRQGMFTIFATLLEKIAGGREWLRIAGGAALLDTAVHASYQHRKSLVAASIWRLLGWLLGTGEIWLIMLFLNHPLSLYEALMLESLAQAVRAAGFFIPGAVGVQEGGFLLLGATLGIPPHIALALSLAKRMRELLLGIPGLIVWQYKTVWHIKTVGQVKLVEKIKNSTAENTCRRP
ncbi:MAG: lysylphosphatidylglycerol synthase domain-containing protein, partial [Mariprofundaceae bacterium]|nr:lysylphosphatidylglycerol synthase domain-containing protein [Mariprofundaceae bacterium]